MAGLDLIQVQDVIEAYIKAEFPGYAVYDEDVLDDEAILKINGKAKPYMILVWGGLNRSTGNTSFAGTRFDEYNSSLDLVIAAPNSRQARRSINVVRDKLIGWKPVGGGAMTSAGGYATSVINDSAGRPHVYLASCRLEFAVNSSGVGSHITP